MDHLKRKRRTRGGHCSFIKKTFGKVKGMLSNPERDRGTLYNRKSSLEEQLAVVQALDNEILRLLENADETEEAAISNEIEEAGVLRADIKAAMKLLGEMLHEQKGSDESESNGEQATLSVTDVSSAKSVRVRLPKLEIQKFDGKIERWQEFWDSFKSSVDENPALSDVDKFSYLRGLLKDQTRDSISGYALTSVNYKSAKEQLQKRYGRSNVIQKIHIRELLKLQPVHSDRDPSRLRALYDETETHHRGSFVNCGSCYNRQFVNCGSCYNRQTARDCAT